MQPVRTAYSSWPAYNRALRDVVGELSPEQIRLAPAEGRWPVWAVVGHLACQRVFSLCDVAGEPGTETTPFPNAAYDCPGDDDLENVLEAGALVHALDSTFAIIERVLDSWSLEELEEVVTRTWENGESRKQSRSAILQRSFAHDVSHISEVNETLSRFGLSQVRLWD